MTWIKTIDAEVAGEAVRLVVDGAPSVPGRTMGDKLAWLKKRGEELRTFLMLEPRGHAGMHGALLTEPVSPDAHAGVLSMHAGGFPDVSGEGVIAAVTIALEHGLIHGVDGDVAIDTPAGLFRARPRFASAMAPVAATAPEAPEVVSVALTGVPSYVDQAGLRVQIGTRHANVDVAFGGELYAIVDSEAVGIPVDIANADALVRMAREVMQAVRAPVRGTIFTGAPRASADLRSATVLHGGVLRRSPGVTGTAALLSVLDAMGLLQGDAQDHRFAHEGVIGTVLHGTVISREQSDGRPTVRPLIEGSATVTGFHEFRR